MKTQYAVKFESSSNHTSRVHDNLDAAISDLARCQKSAKSGKDEQGIEIVIVEGDSFRRMDDEEMDAFASRCQALGVIA